jgi:2-polyprenyl-3-methyl-5-hydroxy-6-metoxy-1,4-benzoquinol methylase
MGDVWLAIFQARAVMAATRLGVFEALGEGRRGVEDVASATGLRPDATELLLRLLACTPYVRRRARGQFTLTRTARRWLVRASPRHFVDMMELMYLNLEWFGELEEVLRTGRGVDMHARLRDETEWRTYQRAMREAARLQAPLVARHVPVRRGAARLLDLGGGHGIFAAAVCRRHAGLRADVLDLPEALGAAREAGREEGVDDVVNWRAGDARHDELGRGYDVVLASNLLHHFAPEENRNLLRRARAALTAGGCLAIWDFARPAGRPDLVADGMALLFRVTSGAAVYGAQEYAAWMRDAGCSEIHTRRFLAAPGQILLVARV